MADARLSQLPVEVLRGDQPAPDLRLSQAPIEVLRGNQPAPDLRLSQLPVEVLVTVSDTPARLSQLPVEVLRGDQPPPDLRLSQLPVEVLQVDTRASVPLSVTQVALETGSQVDGAAAVSQVATEVAHQQLASAIEVTQAPVEIAWQAPGELQVSQLVLEVIRRRVTPGTLIVTKRQYGNEAAPVFGFASDDLTPNNWTLAIDASRVFTDLLPGLTYSVVETLPAEWHQYSAVVSNGSPLNAITVAEGETVRATVTNVLCECCVSTKLDIANRALLRIGVSKTMVALNDPTREATTVGQIFEPARRTVLRRFPWAFATRYATLTLVDGSPSDPANGDWIYAYRHPTDSVFNRRILNAAMVQGFGRQFDPNPIPFRVGNDADGLLIYTNQEDAVLEYTLDVACSADWGDAIFEDALAWYVASQLAPSLSRDSKMADKCMAMFEGTLPIATTVSAREKQDEPDGEAEWIRANDVDDPTSNDGNGWY
jgi:hypothetical protein